MRQAITEKIKGAPKNPGVYIFSSGKTVLYIGKATNLENRLRSYLKVTDMKTESLHQEATKLEYLILRSEIEALIEESRLIKELKPKYNILFRDDKSYLYVAITKELLSQGSVVFVLDINAEQFKQTEKELATYKKGGAGVFLVEVDVSNREKVHHAIKQVI